MGAITEVGARHALPLLCRFVGALEGLLSARDAAAFETVWSAHDLDQLGWEALALARRAHAERLELPLAQLDRRLLALLERTRGFLRPPLLPFRVPGLG